MDNVTKEAVERAFETIVDSVIPKFTSKSIKIDTKVAAITIKPFALDFAYVTLVV